MKRYNYTKWTEVINDLINDINIKEIKRLLNYQKKMDELFGFKSIIMDFPKEIINKVLKKHPELIEYLI